MNKVCEGAVYFGEGHLLRGYYEFVMVIAGKAFKTVLKVFD